MASSAHLEHPLPVIHRAELPVIVQGVPHVGAPPLALHPSQGINQSSSSLARKSDGGRRTAAPQEQTFVQGSCISGSAQNGSQVAAATRGSVTLEKRFLLLLHIGLPTKVVF